jgi:hypothetical protein
LSLVNIAWRPSPKELRKFGVVVMVGLAIIGLVFQFWLRNASAAYGIYIAGLVLGLPALTGWPVALPGYWLWMGIAFVMGNIMGRLLLSVFYFGLFTPMGLLRRLVNDKLQLRAKGASTYWHDLPSTDETSRFERQF